MIRLIRIGFAPKEVLKGVIKLMRKKGMLKATSVAIALCTAMSSMTFAFSATASAATVDNSQSVSLSSTAAGSLVENDGFTWDNASVYFLLTDRFRNGNTSNDHSYGRATDKNGNPLSGWETSPGTFHGGDFAGVTQSIEEGYFDNLGINALWISAPYEQIHGYCDSGTGFAHYSYHGYYVLDYTETDANFGTAEEFQTLVDTAHEHGIRVIMDIVMNHSGYNTVKDMEEFNFGTLLDGASDYKYKLTGVSDVNSHIDFKSSASDWGRWWGNDWIRSGLPGYTEGAGDNYTMSLQGLPDFRTEQTKSVSIPPILKTKWTQEGTYDQKISRYGSSNTVTGYISSWLADWVRKYGVDGFRCDTAKHVENASWNQLKTACVSALKEWRANNPGKAGADWKEDFWMTGEAWDHGVGYDDYYSKGGFDSMINFSTCGGGAIASGSVANTYQGYADQINSKEGFNVLSFISSHDEVLTRGDQNTMIYNGSAFLLLPGAVQTFYGDETNRPMVEGLAFDGSGGSGHSLRSDMNWDSIDKTVLAHWQKVGQFRKNHVSVGAGSNTKLSATNGVAFGRTYDKNGVSDKVAAVIGCNKNTSVTVDVSSLWKDGDYVINAYDNSSSVVTGGKVTFNSGVNGTILMENADGQPLVSVTGEAQFYGTEQVKVSLKDCDSAKVSVDGGNKFVVKDGDTFTIGSTGYKNDTIEVAVEAKNDKASTEAKFTFLKLGEPGEVSTNPTQTTVPPVTVSQTSKLTIKSTSGAPNVYAWTGASDAQLGAWPGTKATAVSGQDNVYEVTLPVPANKSFNVVLNNGSSQSKDITGLYNGAVLEIPNGNYAGTTVVSTGSQQGGGDEPYEGSVSITIVPFNSSASYNIYAWTDTQKLTGAWPGTKLTEKDANGNYVVTFDKVEKVNVIINNGSGQTADITDVADGSTIQITNEGCTTYKLTDKPIVLSPVEKLKKEAREVLAMTSSDYTASTWANVQSVMTSANALIKLGDSADEAQVNTTLESLKSAKAALQLNTPALSYAVKGKNTVSGTVAPDSKVTVTVNGTVYTAQADDVTGEFTVTTATLNSSSALTFKAERNGLSSAIGSYNMSKGDITSPIIPTVQPTTAQPTTAKPTTQPTTAKPTTQPTTATPTTQPTTAKPTQGTNLNVTATSNYFPDAKVTLVNDNELCVEYQLKSSMLLVNAEWGLTYDSAKLELDTAKSKDFMPEISNEVTNIRTGSIKSNFTDITDLKDFTTSKTFVRAYFKVIGTGDTTVNLNLNTLCVGYIDSNFSVNFEAVVRNSVVQSGITSVAGYENLVISKNTKAYQYGETATDLTVNAASNYFPNASVKVTEDKTVCVEYILDSSMDLVNAEWTLSYDNTKLELDTAKSKDFMPNISGEVTSVKTNNGTVKSNFTDISNLADFKGGKVFVRAYFKVIGTGNTTVNLNVTTLSVGYFDDNFSLSYKPVVRQSVIQSDVTSTPGFENVSLKRNTKVYEYNETATDLTINAKSNYFPNASVKVTEDKTVCVEYILDSSMDLVNAEWTLTYDKTKLELDTTISKDFMPNVPNEVTSVRPNEGTVQSNFTDISNLADFKGGKVFVRAYFKTVGTGETTVNLNVNTLSVGYFDDDFKLNYKPVVRQSTIQSDVTSTPGFENVVINRNTKIYEYEDSDIILGDVTGDGQISVNDVTAIQLYLAEDMTFTEKQMKAADVNKDGKVTINDVTRIQEFIAGSITEF